ncbi:MAG: SPOR domain-containing protein [Rhodospirillales bacterium]|jgi:hypothetical protein|nr:SPOR domain-containing protein [Rhodospirillales bacterium]MDP6884331.1 SPOR domain-containing protein [Rhodospirillales bacterium]
MGRWALILASVVVLSGCAVPLPVRVASWALDGLSYLATQKSVADHGISLVAEQDCSILRGVTQKQFCIDNLPSDTAVAALDEGGDGEIEISGDVEVAATAVADGDMLNEFETAAGPAPGVDEMESAAGPVSDAPKPVPAVAPRPELAKADRRESAPTLTPTATRRVAKDDPAIAKLAAAVPPRRPPLQPREVKIPVGTGFYYVVGSFLYLDNARSLADEHASLAPTIVEARLDGQTHFRVVVGPFERSGGKELRRQIRRAGISDAWAIALNPVQWSLAKSRPSTPPEVANALAAQ